VFILASVSQLRVFFVSRFQGRALRSANTHRGQLFIMKTINHYKRAYPHLNTNQCQSIYHLVEVDGWEYDNGWCCRKDDTLLWADIDGNMLPRVTVDMNFF